MHLRPMQRPLAIVHNQSLRIRATASATLPGEDGDLPSLYVAPVPNVTTRSGSIVNMTRTSPVRIGV